MDTSIQAKKFIIAKYKFEAEEENEIACNAGDVFEILNDFHADWLLVVRRFSELQPNRI